MSEYDWLSSSQGFQYPGASDHVATSPWTHSRLHQRAQGGKLSQVRLKRASFRRAGRGPVTLLGLSKAVLKEK